MKKNNYKKEIVQYIKNQPIINTHSHHYKDDFFIDMNVDKILLNSYVNWSGVVLEDSKESRENYISKVKYKSYFIWLQKSLKGIYNIDTPLSSSLWSLYSTKIKQAYNDGNNYLNILMNKCNYKT